MTVRLRPHHLLCLLTHVGKGYSPGFTRNMARIAERIADQEAVEIIEGPDDICAPICKGAFGKFAHCHSQRVGNRDRIAGQQIATLLGVAIHPGAHITWNANLAGSLRRAYAAGDITTACQGCRWQALCSSVAATDFAGTTL